MNRLTTRNITGKAVFKKAVLCGRCNDSIWRPITEIGDDVADRLAAYEDTGLTPEEIVKMGMAFEDNKRYSGRLEGRLKAYKQAKAEGRLLILPCEVSRMGLIDRDIEILREMEDEK